MENFDCVGVAGFRPLLAPRLGDLIARVNFNWRVVVKLLLQIGVKAAAVLLTHERAIIALVQLAEALLSLTNHVAVPDLVRPLPLSLCAALTHTVAPVV